VKHKRNIILTGFMGTGKSSVGRAIAKRLGRPFIDTDALIEKEAGMTITSIFNERGEVQFRALERTVIDKVCEQHQAAIIATGGGAMVNEDNARRLKESGMVICLTATPAVILSRVQGNEDRPLLKSDNPLEKIRTLLEARAEAYAKADLTIDTSHLSLDEVVKTISRRLKLPMGN
jgi:shikimate kinase